MSITHVDCMPARMQVRSADAGVARPGESSIRARREGTNGAGKTSRKDRLQEGPRWVKTGRNSTRERSNFYWRRQAHLEIFQGTSTIEAEWFGEPPLARQNTQPTD